MLFTKSIVKGYTTRANEVVVRIEINCCMSDADLDVFLEPLRKQFNEMGEALHFNMTLESQDI